MNDWTETKCTPTHGIDRQWVCAGDGWTMHINHHVNPEFTHAYSAACELERQTDDGPSFRTIYGNSKKTPEEAMAECERIMAIWTAGEKAVSSGNG